MQNLADLIKQKPQFKKLEESFKKGSLNHSFLVVCQDSILTTVFCKTAANLICGEHNIADKHFYCTFQTPDCEDLISKTHLKPMLGSNKVFVIDADNLSGIVQNKMLKTIEEPPVNTFFFITGKSINSFLPTVRSRTEKIVLENLSKNDFETLGINFFEKSSGNVFLAQSLSNPAFAKKFDFVLQCLQSLKKSSEIIGYARKFAKTREELSETLEIFETIMAGVLKSKTKGENFYSKILSEEFSARCAAMVIDTILKAKKQLKANCAVSAIIDNFLLKILEYKYICKKSS